VSAPRPDGACVLHRPPIDDRPWCRAEPRRLVCGGCYDRVREVLREIGERWSRLDPGLAASGEEERGGSGFVSSAPVSLYVVAMEDPRSSAVAKVWVGEDGRVYAEQERPPLSVWGVLDTIYYLIAEARGFTELNRYDVPDLVEWIDKQLDWATRQPLIVEMEAQLHPLVVQLRAVTGDRRTLIGRCPTLLEDGECGAELWSPPYGSTAIVCRSCGRRWPRPEWEHLLRLLSPTS
jgi:hypothetical protein